MLSERVSGRSVIVLVADDENAESLARMLSELRTDIATVSIHLPPLRGMGFFADGESQRQLDEWWEAQIPSEALPVFVIDHCAGLADWLVGIDGAVFVGVNAPGANTTYAQCANVRLVEARSPLDYAAAVMGDLVDLGFYRREDVDRVRALAASLREREALIADPAAQVAGVSDDQRADPFDLLIAMSLEHAGALRPGPTVTSHDARASRAQERHAIRLPAWTHLVGARRRRTELSDSELADQLVRRGLPSLQSGRGRVALARQVTPRAWPSSQAVCSTQSAGAPLSSMLTSQILMPGDS